MAADGHTAREAAIAPNAEGTTRKTSRANLQQPACTRTLKLETRIKFSCLGGTSAADSGFHARKAKHEVRYVRRVVRQRHGMELIIQVASWFLP